jgi:hypothetical protein
MRMLNLSRRSARTLTVSWGAAALLLCAPAAANADPAATVIHFAGFDDVVSTDICAFPVADHLYQEGTLTIRQTGTGTLFEVSAREVDTFSANGVSLTSNPVSYHFTGKEDLQGNIVQQTTSGLLVKVPLPDGSTFFSAGRVDMLASGLSFVVLPDVGTSHGLDEFCAALAG